MRRRLLFIVLFVTALLGTAWWFLPQSIGFIAARLAGSVGLRDVSINLDRVSASSAHARHIAFILDTGQGPATVRLNDVSITFDLAEVTIRTLHSSVAVVEWQQLQTSPSTDEPVTIPVLPAAQITIDELTAVLRTSLVSLKFVGDLTASADPKKGLDIAVHRSGDSVRIKLPADASKLSLDVADHTQAAPLSAKIADPLGSNTRIDLQGQVTPLLRWLPKHIIDNDPLNDWLRNAEIEQGNFAVDVKDEPKTSQWIIPKAALDITGFKFDELLISTKTTLSAHPSDQGWRFDFPEDSDLQIKRLAPAVQKASLRIGSGTRIGLNFPPDQFIVDGAGSIRWRAQYEQNTLSGLLDNWRLQSKGESKIELRDIDVKPAAVQAGLVRLTSSGLPGESPTHGTIAITGLGPAMKSNPSSAVIDLTGSWTHDGNIVSTAGMGKAGPAPLFKWTADMDLAKGSGSAKLTIATEASALNALIASTYASEHAPVVSSGRIDGDLQLSWSEHGFKGSARTRGDKIDIDISEAKIQGAGFNVQIPDLSRPRYGFSVSVPKTSTAVGLDIDDLHVNGSYHGNVINIDNAGIKVLGGEIKVLREQLIFNQDHKLVVQVKDLDLERLLALANITGLSGTGRLTGKLPLLIYPGGVEVADSFLESTENGQLRYVIDQGANAQLDNIALQALQDFRYDSLTAKVGYRRNGEYLIQAKLKGRNPKLYDGYPLAFNINLNGKLPGLMHIILWSMVTGDFDREVLKQIRLESGKVTPPGQEAK